MTGAACRPAAAAAVRFLLQADMVVLSLLRTRCPASILIPCRFSGHGHTMPIRPSPFMWHKFKDMLHLYLMVGYVPTVCLATYMNLTVGPAELSETPEGYEPEYWEFEKHPVTRLVTKTFFDHPAEDYERRMHILNQEAERVICKVIEDHVRNVMAIRNDQMSWYYKPFSAKYVRRMRDYYYRFAETMGVYIQRYDLESDVGEMDSPTGSDGIIR